MTIRKLFLFLLLSNLINTTAALAYRRNIVNNAERNRPFYSNSHYVNQNFSQAQYYKKQNSGEALSQYERNLIASTIRSIPKQKDTRNHSKTQSIKRNEVRHYIRHAQFSDLPQVSQIITEAFYDPSSIFKHYHIVSELNRLQSNFPYIDADIHHMYVACIKERLSSEQQQEVIVGFVDVDCRPCSNPTAPPRPYLSDLAVHKKFRRKGIATTLISACEQMVSCQERNNEKLFLRVERANEPALKMYARLGYEIEPSEIFGVIDTTILLKKVFNNDRLGK